MNYQLKFQPYQKQFRQPLYTHHGTWKTREGIIITLTDRTGQKSLGEIAPLPWFGSETHQQALDFCHQLGHTITEETIYNIPVQLPACQFGFETAIENLSLPKIKPQIIEYSYLLPTGKTVLSQWQEIYQQAKDLAQKVTFKWKIGVDTPIEEIIIFEKLCQALPKDVTLRLDANGGLKINEAKTWLSVIDRWSKVEFLEQPLSPEYFEAMLQLSIDYQTPLALDESVATLQQIQDCYEKGWRSIFVIKPAIIGSILKLRQLFKKYPIDAVFSSVFETAIGQQKAIQLALELTECRRAIGFGLNHWFLEDEKE
jgi:o-succinylbenzoate synthase